MIHALINLALFIGGIFVGSNFNKTSARMEGYDEGFKDGKAVMLRKFELHSQYNKVSDGRKE